MIKSSENVHVAYAGEPLESATLYYWRVRWWDSEENKSPYSDISYFGTALLKDDDWKARWLSMENPAGYGSNVNKLYGGIDPEALHYYAIYLRNEFALDKRVRRACAYVCGLGYFELRLNGQKVGDHVLDPGDTDYKALALYSSYDITQQVQTGANAAGLILGNGRHIEAFGYGKPRAILQVHVEYEDGARELLLSDGNWKTSHGPLMENGIYFGERYDAGREMPGWDMPAFDDSMWTLAEIVEGPPLASRMMPPVRATQSLKPQRIFSPRENVFIYDFGQNLSGWARLSVAGPAGTEVRLRFSELLDENNMLNTSSRRNAEATDTYILKGDGEEIYEPRFTYHGFRYVEVTGFPGVPAVDNLEAFFIHSDIEEAGSFQCSNELLNAVHRNIRWGQLSNLISIPMDCPQRDERMGWMGDAQLAAEEALYNFHITPFFAKYLRDIQVSQKEDGSLSDVVPPYWALYPADPAWGSAYITIAWYCFLFTGDTRLLEEHFEGMSRYIDFLKTYADDNILRVFGRYGDWCAPGMIQPMKTPPALTSSWYFYHDTLLLSRIAAVLRREKERLELEALAENIKNAFNREFLDGGRYATNDYGMLTHRYISQTSQALPLYLDMVPDHLKERAIAMLREAVVEQSDCHVDTGIVGTRYLFDALTENGMADVAYNVATQRTYPGWGYMIDEGATTLWERWEKLEGEGMNSHNHIMLGSIDAWFYRTLAGLAPAEPGWKRIRVKPHILGDLKYATATLKTVRGAIHVSWLKGEDVLRMAVGVPTNAVADVYIPVCSPECTIKEGGTTIWSKGSIGDSIEEIPSLETCSGYLHVTTRSGYYEFTVNE
jgi:alpha-L-rhamnosidase